MPVARFPPDVECLSAVRQFLQDQVVGVEPGVTEVVVLLGHELAVNAILHAGTDFDVQVEVAGRCIEVTVSDRSRQLPALAKVDTFDEGGRGLRVVDALADRWGARRTARGKRVWFEIETPGQQPP